MEAKKPALIDIPPPKKPTAAPPAKSAKVVIPEMKTKTSRKYEPEFTKSVLDQPENVQTGPSMRYSDAELQEFRELIQKNWNRRKKNLLTCKDSLHAKMKWAVMKMKTGT